MADRATPFSPDDAGQQLFEVLQGLTNPQAKLDRLVHERARLAILSALSVEKRLSFADLKRILQTTDGNLSVHARKLEEAGYLTVAKFFEGRLPRTEFSITAQGRRALHRYLDHMEALINAMRR